MHIQKFFFPNLSKMQERVKTPPHVEERRHDKKSKVFKHLKIIQGSCEYCAVKIQNVKEAKKVSNTI